MQPAIAIFIIGVGVDTFGGEQTQWPKFLRFLAPLKGVDLFDVELTLWQPHRFGHSYQPVFIIHGPKELLQCLVDTIEDFNTVFEGCINGKNFNHAQATISFATVYYAIRSV